MALTGMTINEADALFAGLADYYVPVAARDELYAQLLAPRLGPAMRPWTVSR